MAFIRQRTSWAWLLVFGVARVQVRALATALASASVFGIGCAPPDTTGIPFAHQNELRGAFGFSKAVLPVTFDWRRDKLADREARGHAAADCPGVTSRFTQIGTPAATVWRSRIASTWKVMRANRVCGA